MKILKWVLPIISYLVFVGLFFLMSDIDRMIYGERLSDTPIILPNSALFIFFSPIILFGYILVVISQCLFDKKEKLYKIFIYSLIVVSIMLLILSQLKYIVDWVYFIFIILSPFLLYYLFFFISLFYILRKEKSISKKMKK